MTEEEFVAQLTCSCLTTKELREDHDGFLRFQEWLGPFYYATEDLFVTDLQLFIPKGREFRFALSQGDGMTVVLRHDT